MQNLQNFIKKWCFKVSKQVQNFICENSEAFIVRQSLLGPPLEYIKPGWLVVCNWLSHDKQRYTTFFPSRFPKDLIEKVWKWPKKLLQLPLPLRYFILFQFQFDTAFSSCKENHHRESLCITFLFNDIIIGDTYWRDCTRFLKISFMIADWSYLEVWIVKLF